MESVSFELKTVILQYSGVVFPLDKDLLSQNYDRLLKYAIKNHHVGHLRSLLDIKICKNGRAIGLAIDFSRPECLNLLLLYQCYIPILDYVPDPKCRKLLRDGGHHITYIDELWFEDPV